jgi:serine/threonine protein kinase
MNTPPARSQTSGRAPSTKPIEETMVETPVTSSQKTPPNASSGNKPGEEGDLQPGTMLGNYQIEKILGRGGMGAVYLAKHAKLERKYAVKTMSRQLSTKEAFVGRFYREAKAMAKIEHPNVVKCYDVDESNGMHYVVMELIDGQSMQDWMKQLKTLSIADAVLVTILCAEALKHAHSLNMVHRDIKPDNILVTRKGEVKVSDLGLAKSLDDEEMSLTQSGTGLGTPYYMAPEQARNAKHVDGRCDIYALGGTLYHFLTGGYPFKADSTVELIMEKEKGIFKRASLTNKQVPERLDLIIDKCMAKKPEHRYSTCEELIRDLENLGVAGTSLSFINSPDKVVARGGSGAATMTNMKTASTAPRMPAAAASSVNTASKASSTVNPAASAAAASTIWFVKHKGSDGKETVTKTTQDKVIAALQSGKIDISAQATRDPKRPFAALGQFSEFNEVVQKKAAAIAAEQRGKKLQDSYKKIDAQYQRQKWWRFLDRMKDGVIGWISLVGLIALMGLAAYFAYAYLWPIVYEMVQGWAGGMGLKPEK